jgi:hypothetical protein
MYMPQASRPRLRESAALALAIYGMVLIAGPALLHDLLCPGHHSAQCVLCASVEAPSSLTERPAALTPDRSDAGAIDNSRPAPCGVCVRRVASDRAPPAVL